METPLDLYYQEGIAKIKEQDEFRRELFGRASNFLTTSIALSVAGILILTLVEQDLAELGILFSAGSAVICWGIVFAMWFWAILPIRGWNNGSALDSLSAATRRTDLSETAIKWHLADNYRDAWKSNKSHLDHKLAVVSIAGFALFGQSVCIVAYAVLVVLSL